MTPVAFDFRKPPAGEIERHVTSWLTATCRRATEACTHTLPYPTAIQLSRVESLSATACLASLPQDAVGLPLAGDGSMVLVLGNPLLLALLAGLVGETPTALPEAREPTKLELSLVPHLIGELFAAPLERSWPGDDPPALAVGVASSPNAAWRGGSERTLLATLSASTPFGDQPIFLLMRRTSQLESVTSSSVRPVAVTPEASKQIESLVREMAVEMSVVLGSVELTMHDLAGLTAGDIVVFDQNVHQPLDGLVAGSRKFRVWPGVVGQRAAVVVDTIAEG